MAGSEDRQLQRWDGHGVHKLVSLAEAAICLLTLFGWPMVVSEDRQLQKWDGRGVRMSKFLAEAASYLMTLLGSALVAVGSEDQRWTSGGEHGVSR